MGTRVVGTTGHTPGTPGKLFLPFYFEIIIVSEEVAKIVQAVLNLLTSLFFPLLIFLTLNLFTDLIFYLRKF